MSMVAVSSESSAATRIAPHEAHGGAAHIFAVFLCGAFAFLDLYCVQPLLPLLSHVFRASEAQVGVTISASTIGVALSAVLLAIFGERLPRKRTIVVSMVGLAVATLLTSSATDLVSLACWRFVQGFVTPGIFIITIAYVTEEWPALKVPRVMSVYVAGTVFGGFVGRLLGGVIADHLGWHSVFFVLGTIGACGAFATHRLLPTERRRTPIAAPVRRLDPLLASVRNPRLLATFAIGFCMLFTLISTFSFITFYVSAAPFDLSTASISYLFGVYLIGLGATLAVGTVLARIGLRHGMLAAVGLCLGGLGFTLVHTLFFVALGLALASSGVFIAQTCANSFLRDAAPAGSRVSAAGLYIASYYIGGSVGGVLPGLAWRAGGWPACAALTASFLVIAGMTAFFGWPARKAASDPIPL
jgi:YNFM family putative membrane transporter